MEQKAISGATAQIEYSFQMYELDFSPTKFRDYANHFTSSEQNPQKKSKRRKGKGRQRGKGKGKIRKTGKGRQNRDKIQKQKKSNNKGKNKSGKEIDKLNASESGEVR